MAWIDTQPTGSKDPKKKLYIYYYDPHRKMNVKKVTPFFNKYPDKKLAKMFLDKFEASARVNKFVFDFPFMDTPSFSQAFQKFKASRITEKSTIDTYTHAYNKFLKFVKDKPLTAYTKQDGIDFIKGMKEKGLSENTIASYSKQLAVMWKWFIAEEMAIVNIIRTMPRKKTPIRTIPDEDLKKIFSYFWKKDKLQYDFVRFTYLTGFRPSTSLLINTDDIDLENETFFYPNFKEKKQTIFPMHSELKEHLQQMDLTPGRKLFPWTDRKLMWFHRAIHGEDLQMNYNLKMLRKTLGTLIANSLGMTAAQIMLDHEDQSTTQNYYARVIIEQLKKDINSKVVFVK